MFFFVQGNEGFPRLYMREVNKGVFGVSFLFLLPYVIRAELFDLSFKESALPPVGE